MEITTWLVVMTREFPDELLSAFLDNELCPAERAQVEQHLAASTADRQLLAELKTLRSEVGSLPPVTVSPGFADRVVRAAVAEAQKQQVALAPSRQSARRRLAIATGAVAALALSLLLFLRPWQGARPEPGPVIVKTDPIESTVPIETTVEKTVAKVVAIKDQFLAALVATAPSDSEAVVLRVRVGKDVRLSEALDAALNKVGISPLASDASSAAIPWQESYRRLLETKYGSTAGGPNEKLLTSTVAAAEALFIEAPLERVDARRWQLSPKRSSSRWPSMPRGSWFWPADRIRKKGKASSR